MRKIAVGFALLFFVSGALTGCGDGSPEKTPTPVRVEKVSYREEGAPLRFTATVTPYSQVSLDFKVEGYVREIMQVEGADGRMRNVQEGDDVTKGTPLAAIDDTEYVSKVIEAKSQLGEARASLEKSSAEFERSSILFSTKSVTVNNYDEAKKEYEVALAQVEGGKAKVVGAEENLAYCTIRPPMNGVVLERDIEVGSYVRPGITGFVIADVTSVKVLFAVPDVTLGDVKLGQEMSVTTESIRDTVFKGRITEIAPQAGSRSRVFNVGITIPNPENLLKPGMIASLALDTQAGAAPLMLIPIGAVVSDGGDGRSFAVFVAESEGEKHIAKKRPVELGSVYGNRISVTEGLEDGDAVVVMGSQLIREGEEISITP